MDHLTQRFRTLLLPLAVPVFSMLDSATVSAAPQGCGSNVSSLYYNLCDLSAVWGVVLEAFASAGILACVILLMVLLASLPFVSDAKRRSLVGLDTFFLICTLGLFGLTFAFIVGKDFATCASRRYLFGVLFAGCFSCLLIKAVNLNLLSRSDSGLRGWMLCLGALAFWLVEVVINTEWLIITIVRFPITTVNLGNSTVVPAEPVPCNIANQDFVMALIYVLTLLLAVVVASLPVLCGKHKQWHKDGVFILLVGLLSAGIWVAWIVMYTYGNTKHGGPTWDDPTLAIALVANAWVFVLLYTIPELCILSEENEAESSFGEDLYPSRGYETILKEQSTQNIFMENKAFSMDEPNPGNKPVSPYSNYNGQLRSSVYQPTELALITKGLGSQMDVTYDTAIPRASLGSPHNRSGSSSSPSPRPEDSPGGQNRATNGNGLHWKPQWSG